MKKTFLHLLLLMGCACCFPSCVEDKAEDAAARLTVRNSADNYFDLVYQSVNDNKK